MKIRTERADRLLPWPGDYRVLVERHWPVGLETTAMRIDEWRKELAPSEPLMAWLEQDPKRWLEFKARYFAELDQRAARVQALRDRIAVHAGDVTLVFWGKNERHNGATALKDYLERRSLTPLRLAANGFGVRGLRPPARRSQAPGRRAGR